MSEQDQKPTEAENQATDDLNIIDFDGGEEIDTSTDGPEDNKDQDKPATDKAQTDVSQAKTTTPDSEGETGGTPINQEAVQRKIDKAIFAKYEEQRKREKIEAELEEAKKKLSAYDTTVIVIPDMPDAFDPNYDQKVIERDEALKKQAEANAAKQLEQKQAEDLLQKQAEAEREKITGYVNTMYAEAEKVGIKKEDLQKADDRVATFIKDPGLATYIISHEKAPLIINQLASDIAELEQISQMSPISAAAYIESKILPKTANFKPAVPNTPDPLEVPKGKPGGDKKSPYLEGVVME